MKERPIIFQDWGVRAILDGRKTQTRRVIKLFHPHEQYDIFQRSDGRWKWEIPEPPHALHWLSGELRCPCGIPGDLLWVRETFRRSTIDTCWRYRADCPPHEDGHWQWKPSIHMPRWASRLTLRLADVRVQRVQEITPADCEAEGIEGRTLASPVRGQPYEEYTNGDGFVWALPILAFASLWDSINAKRGYGWELNPWVWALSFEVLQ